MAKEFIVDGAPCMCKFGAAPGMVKVTDNSFFMMNGSKLSATTMTLGNVMYPPGFGVCKVNPAFPKPCIPAVTQWSGQFAGLKTSAGGYPLTDESKGTCSSGSPDCIEFTQTGQKPIPGPAQFEQATAEHQGDLDLVGESAGLKQQMNLQANFTAGSSPRILVKAVTGPARALPGEKVKYQVTKYNVDNPPADVKAKIKWRVEIDGKEQSIAQPNNDVLELTLKQEWAGKELTVMPYLNQSTVKVSQKTQVMKLQLYLLFWIKEKKTKGGKSVEDMFPESAQTRLNNIKNSNWYNESIHKVHCPPIQSLDEISQIIKNHISNYGGKSKIETAEIGVFSHSGSDGPICYNTSLDESIAATSQWPHQMNITAWGSIDFNWSEENAICVFYGCNSGHNTGNGFAKRLSKLPNFSNVNVWGQATSSFPSLYPDRRVSVLIRHMGIGFDMSGQNQTYMVGGNSDQGWESTSFKPSNDLNEEQLKKYPKANPMNSYKNGKLIITIHQGYFNDHRKNK